MLGRKKKDPDDKQTFGKTGIVFSREESKGPKRVPTPSSEGAKADDLLGDDGSDTAASAKSEEEGSGGDVAASAAMQASRVMYRVTYYFEWVLGFLYMKFWNKMKIK